MHDFQYHRAASVAGASAMLRERPEAKLLAGGMSLLPMMKHRLQRASDIIDLCDLAELRGIAVTDGVLAIKAMTTHTTVAYSEVVRKAAPAIAYLAGHIGDPHCRNRGTIGGSLAHSDPAACYPSAVLSLGAIIRTNQREIPADEYFHGMYETALDKGEIVTEVRFPIPERACYIKFPQPASRFALAGIFVSQRKGVARVAVTGCAAKVFRVLPFEEALSRAFRPEAIEGIEVPQAELTGDIYADPEYRAHLIGVLTQRAVAGCFN